MHMHGALSPMPMLFAVLQMGVSLRKVLPKQVSDGPQLLDVGLDLQRVQTGT